MKIGIYGFQNKLQPNKWYVGQSQDIEKRWSEYRLLRCKTQRKWFNALRKYGYDAFVPVILEECTPLQLASKEAFWVEQKNSVVNGYNCKTGGFNGGKHSKETKELLRKLGTGRRVSPETIEKHKAYRATDETKRRISKALLGNKYAAGMKHTEETKAHLSMVLKGRPKTEEHKAKIRAAHLARGRSH